MIGVKVNSGQTRAVLSNTGKRAGGVISPTSPVPGLIWKDMQVRVDSVFQHNRKGGVWRGAAWPYFANQYTRKTDGVVVPAWGGVPKLRGKGLVKGRLRPSGTRVTSSSSVMQDTGELRRGAASVLHVGRNRMTIGADARVGKRASALSLRRPFLFWTSDDIPMIRGYIEQYLAGQGHAGNA